MPLPPITETGDLPQGVHQASLREVVNHFGQTTRQRKLVGMRLERVYELAAATGHVKRFIVFGSFVTAKPEPNDVDVFLIMLDTFDLNQVTGEARLIFDHPVASALWGQYLLVARARRPTQRRGRSRGLAAQA